MAKTGQKRRKSKEMGRYVSAQGRGSYTAPRPANTEHSPRWYGWLLLGLLVLGLVIIVLNYLGVLPGSVSPWYLVAGLVSMFSAFYLATLYR
ncbi:MAG: cell division protein CrgA [Acidimicrobiales bacterium]|jgi:FtsH-binding integral membrane protein